MPNRGPSTTVAQIQRTPVQVATSAADPQDPREGLAAVVALRRLLGALEAENVERALAAGWSWTEIAEGLGVSRQAVHKKYARRPGFRLRHKGDG